MSTSYKNLYHYSCFLYLAIHLISYQLAAQTPQLTTKVDSLSVKIGASLHYTLEIIDDTIPEIRFLDFEKNKNTIGTWHLSDSINSDTTVHNQKYIIRRGYYLINFESGIKTIPQLEVVINDSIFKTDSLLIEVRNIKVDTISKNIFDIKPMIKSDSELSTFSKNIVWGVVLALLIIAGAIYYFRYIYKKPLTEEERIALMPPFDKAQTQIHSLKKSKYLLGSNFKTYYTKTTNILRLFLKERIDLDALESTTKELYQLLSKHNLNLDANKIKQLNQTLERSDLVKFAKHFPEMNVAVKDLELTESFINYIENIVRPLELKKEQEVKTIETKKSKKRAYTKWILILGLGIGFMIFSSIWAYQTFFRKNLEDIYNQEWNTSLYGYPEISILSPDILERIPIEKNGGNQLNSFFLGSLSEPLYLRFSQFNLQQSDSLLGIRQYKKTMSEFEQSGGVNILYKDETYKTTNNIEVAEFFGGFDIINQLSKKDIKKKYHLFYFTEKNSLNEIVLVTDEDINFSPKIKNRIIESIKVSKLE